MKKLFICEIDKLRELVRDYERCTMHADCSRCEYDGKLRLADDGEEEW